MSVRNSETVGGEPVNVGIGPPNDTWEERPWGGWQVLLHAPGYKVKRLFVHPGHRLSLQTHEHRSEHWVVVAGEATCLVGTEKSFSRVGQTVHVPLGTEHRIENSGDVDLVIVEVQIGSYTEEDDIIRLADDYFRT